MAIFDFFKTKPPSSSSITISNVTAGGSIHITSLGGAVAQNVTAGGDIVVTGGASPQSDHIPLSGEQGVRVFEVSSWKEIRLGGVFKATTKILPPAGGSAAGNPYRNGTRTLVEATGDSSLLPFLGAFVEGGVLRFGWTRDLSFEGPSPTFLILTHLVSAISTMDASQMKVYGVHSELLLSASGSSQIIAEGQFSAIQIHGSGASRIEGDSLKGDLARVQLSGAARAQVKALRVQGMMSGASSLHVPSYCQVEVSASGASSIYRIG